MTDSVARLYDAVIAVRGSDPEKSRTARLLRAGRAKMAKKLAEEAVEVVIDAMHGQPEAVVRESADLLYNLVVLWVHAGVRPEQVWAEMRLVLPKKCQKIWYAARHDVKWWRWKLGAFVNAADPSQFSSRVLL
jgi:phosphoribosyl-ATP pyrophosphohydrolase